MKQKRKGPKDRHNDRPSGSSEQGRPLKTSVLRPGLFRGSPPGLTWRELALLAIVFAIGTGLRLWAFSRAAVEHFDEGVYASNLYFGPPEYAYPMQRFYAPPLLPALIETGMIVGLPPNVAAIMPSFLAGCATIVAVWWFGRSWFGPPVGIAAATLVAMNDFHVLYSATALTDVLLGLWLVLAVDAIARALLNSDYRWAVGAGIYTGLAWWTKYNGWLPLAIEGAALPVLWLFRRPPTKQVAAWLACFAVTVLVAAAVWSPYYFSLQSTGGYGPIAANHAKYVVGFAGWTNSASRHVAAQFMLEGAMTWLGLGLSWMLANVIAWEKRSTAAWIRSQWESLFLRACFFILLVALSPFVTAMVFIVVAALLGVAIASWRIVRGLEETPPRLVVGLALVAVGTIALLVTTPCYWPYPRLTLPLLIFGWLGTAVLEEDFLDRFPPLAEAAPPAKSRVPVLAYFAVVGLLVALFLKPLRPAERTLTRMPRQDSRNRSDRRSILRIARSICSLPARTESRSRVIYVYGEPALFFQLRAAGEEIAAPIQEVPTAAATMNGSAAPTYLVSGPHSQRDAEFQRQWAAAESKWELVESFAYQPSAIVWLDLNDPRQPAAKEAREQDQVRLYRLRP